MVYQLSYFTELWVFFDFILNFPILLLRILDGPSIPNSVVVDLVKVIALGLVRRRWNVYFLVAKVLLTRYRRPVWFPNYLFGRAQVVLGALLFEDLFLPLEFFLLFEGSSFKQVLLLLIIQVSKALGSILRLVPR